MFKNILTKVIGDPNERELQRLAPIAEQINVLEPEFERLSDSELRGKTDEFRARIDSAVGELRNELAQAQTALANAADEDERERLEGQVEKLKKELYAAEKQLLDELLPKAFAAVREASKRTIGLRHFDVQLVGGIVLHEGKVAEMKTGEGKTLVATLPLYLNALVGRGAHLVTVNDYLAKRDTQWMGPIYYALGLSVGVIQHESAFLYDPDYPATDDRLRNLRPVHRQEAYRADITYGTNNEFGFDYLRDNMVWDLSQCVQRELHYAIVDEVDNILIDEARTPLIISGPAEESAAEYVTFARLVPRLTGGIDHDEYKELTDEEKHRWDYVVDEKARIATLTETGIEKIERWLNIPEGKSLYDPEHFDKTPYLEQALRAHALYKRDRDYIVKDGQVIIVDEFTGRLMLGRRYSEGLHQAIEAKESVKVQQETLTLATITFQNYFRMYHKLAGMTGTAATEAEEFGKIYNLDVVVIPTHKLMIRTDYPDVVYKSEAAKFRSVVGEIVELHKQGRPVLVGTVSVEKSEMLSEMLRRRGVPHQVLNAKLHEKEAGIIAQAGRSGTVTIATNMAGRGVDILLGGNPEGLAREELRAQGFELTSIPSEKWNQALIAIRQQSAVSSQPSVEGNGWVSTLSKTVQTCEQDRAKVIELGGLHILGTERHEARRIDNQLRGRAGRQGDPGSSRFYVALEDDLMRRFGGQAVAGLMERFGMDEDVPIEHNLVSKSIEQSQVKVEGYNFDLRKHLLEYDDVVNQQRNVIYGQRRKILSTIDLRPVILPMVEDELHELVDTYTAGDDPREWDLHGLLNAARQILPLPHDLQAEQWKGRKPREIEAELIDWAERLYDEKTQRLTPDVMHQVERLVMLRVIDNHWIHHLTALDDLREGIGLRAFGQRDPLVEYKTEAYQMFQQLLGNIAREIAHTIYHVEVRQEPAPRRREMRYGRGATVGGEQPERIQPVKSGAKLGRNDPCWCGSGKKYKHCHMNEDLAKGGRAAAPQAAQAQTTRGDGKKKKHHR